MNLNDGSYTRRKIKKKQQLLECFVCETLPEENRLESNWIGIFFDYVQGKQEVQLELPKPQLTSLSDSYFWTWYRCYRNVHEIFAQKNLTFTQHKWMLSSNPSRQWNNINSINAVLCLRKLLRNKVLNSSATLRGLLQQFSSIHASWNNVSLSLFMAMRSSTAVDIKSKRIWKPVQVPTLKFSSTLSIDMINCLKAGPSSLKLTIRNFY